MYGMRSPLPSVKSPRKSPPPCGKESNVLGSELAMGQLQGQQPLLIPRCSPEPSPTALSYLSLLSSQGRAPVWLSGPQSPPSSSPKFPKEALEVTGLYVGRSRTFYTHTRAYTHREIWLLSGSCPHGPGTSVPQFPVPPSCPHGLKALTRQPSQAPAV